MNDIKLNLNLEETNLLLEALGQMPFVRVHQLIGKIQQQAESQLKNGQNNLEVKEKNLKSE